MPIFLDGNGGAHLAGADLSLRSVQAIADGLIGADRRLPSTRTLAAELGVSRTTTLLALEQLCAEGYVFARRGAGMFIAPVGASTSSPRTCTRDPRRRNDPKPAAHGRRFSWRGNMLSRMPGRPIAALGRGPCAFRIGTPALDLFPQRIWSQLAREVLRR